MDHVNYMNHLEIVIKSFEEVNHFSHEFLNNSTAICKTLNQASSIADCICVDQTVEELLITNPDWTRILYVYYGYKGRKYTVAFIGKRYMVFVDEYGNKYDNEKKFLESFTSSYNFSNNSVNVKYQLEKTAGLSNYIPNLDNFIKGLNNAFIEAQYYKFKKFHRKQSEEELKKLKAVYRFFSSIGSFYKNTPSVDYKRDEISIKFGNPVTQHLNFEYTRIAEHFYTFKHILTKSVERKINIPPNVPPRVDVIFVDLVRRRKIVEKKSKKDEENVKQYISNMFNGNYAWEITCYEIAYSILIDTRTTITKSTSGHVKLTGFQYLLLWIQFNLSDTQAKNVFKHNLDNFKDYFFIVFDVLTTCQKSATHVFHNNYTSLYHARKHFEKLRCSAKYDNIPDNELPIEFFLYDVGWNAVDIRINAKACFEFYLQKVPDFVFEILPFCTESSSRSNFYTGRVDILGIKYQFNSQDKYISTIYCDRDI